MPELLHISDLHFGPAFLPDRAEAALALAERLRPDAVVITGDFTQRARRAQYAAARDYVTRFPVPVLPTPGNHDVPLYRVAERLFASHRNYREYIREERDAVLGLPGCTIVALDSTRRFTFTDGVLRRGQLELATRAFAAAPPGDVRIVATHHPLSPPPDAYGGGPMPRAARALAALRLAGADAVLAGHLHRAWIGRSTDLLPGGGPGFLLVHCGTTTSARGRGRERGHNSLNVVSARDGEIAVAHYLWDAGGGEFRPHSEHRFARAGRGWLDRAGR